MPARPKTLMLIDGSSYVFRAYHAVPHMSSSKGVPTNATFGFARMLQLALREGGASHAAVVFDKDGRAFRQAIDPTYKANRPPTPEDLIPQFESIRRVVDAMNVPLVELAGHEADDVIATLARRAREADYEVVVVTGDKDLLQLLVRDGIELYDTMKERRTKAADVPERLGVRADQVVDYLALVGDAVDNVQGVPGVGPKTAADLLREFGDADALLARLDQVKKPRLREAIRANEAQLRRARDLVRLHDDLAVPVTADDLALRPPDDTRLRALYSELEFASLLRGMGAAKGASSPTGAVTTVLDTATLARLADQLATAKRFAVREITAGPRPRTDPLVGIAFAWDGGCAYLPLGHQYLGAPRQLGAAEALDKLRQVLEDSRRPKLGHDVKAVYHSLRSSGLAPAGFCADSELRSFLLNPGRRDHALADLAREELGRELAEDPAVAPAKVDRAALPVERAAQAAAGAAQAVLALVSAQEPRLVKAGLAGLAGDIEMPLVPVLAEMERTGILVDRSRLSDLARLVDAMVAEHLRKVHQLAGREFNINSNPQLAQVLFAELKLPVSRRGKNGPSADQEVLEKLAAQHPIAREVLEYRSLAKLKGTYIDALPRLVEADGRVHTSFHQLGASTGRLSSSGPNLQNIPVRTDFGKRIREAFVAPEGCLLVSADYSQIELRILAHLSEDSALTDAFRNGEDVHARTAADVYRVAPDAVTPEMRRAAKAINFGIAYGQSAFGLAQRLDLPTAEAQGIIDRYFARYRGVREWLDTTVARAREDGEVRTLFGRVRKLPELSAKAPPVRQAAERMAVNTPIQGTAADIVKKAMIDVARRLATQGFRARMLLQVHDELVFEVPADEVEGVAAMAREAMCGALALRVPLVVDVGSGPSWADAH